LHTFLSQHLDILVITLPLTTSTTNLFSTDEFEQLSAHPNTTTDQKCFLINVARRRIIDQPALVSALNEGLLRSAALDVAVPEPLPKEDPLWDAKNVIITPHISALGVDRQTRSFDVLMTNLAQRQKGQKMFNLADRKKGH
jgi:phosphoglycerate dehydrogenase-like enzyme